MTRLFLASLVIAFLSALAFAGTVSVGVNSSYQGVNGVTVSVGKSIYSTVDGTNVNVINFSCTTVDSAITISPITSNAMITVVNNDATNVQSVIKLGNSTSNYFAYVRPTEVAVFRLLPGGDGYLHVASTNGTSTGTVLIPPNP